MTQLSEYESKSLQRLGEHLHEGRWSNAGMVQIIELAAGYLNAQPIGEYAEANGITYNGAKKCRDTITIMGRKFVVDND